METTGARATTDGGRGLESVMTGSEREAGLQDGQIEIEIETGKRLETEIALETLEEAETARDTVEEITTGAEVEIDVTALKVCTTNLSSLSCAKH